jgi:bacterioferritin-associated ferredoxin
MDATEVNKADRKNSDIRVPSKEDLLCACFGVNRSEIKRLMAQPGYSVEDLVQQTHIGTKCTACLVDLDILFNDIQGERRVQRGDSATQGANEIVPHGPNQSVVEHLDSAFFVVDESVKTILRIANYSPMFEDNGKTPSHTYSLWLMGEDGKVAAKMRGVIPSHGQIEIDFGQLEGCPRRGWFLVSCLPQGDGFYGTLRPQGLLVGKGWSSAFHLQAHGAASNFFRRVSILVKSTDHKTSNSVFVFNAERKPSKLTVELKSRESDFVAECEYALTGNGLSVVDLDASFADLPQSDIMLLSVFTDTATKKYLATIHPDQTWSADHFPTLP